MSINQADTKKNKGQRGPPVKQFQWFEMQTRVRKIIQQIIDPIQYQIVKHTSNIDKLQKNNSSFHDRIQYILRMTTNDPQVFEKGVFKKIEDKFQNQQKTLTYLEEQVKNNTSFVDNKINLIDQRMKQSNDMISQIEQLKTSNRQNLKHQTQKFETVRKNIQQNVHKMSLAIQQNQKASRQKIQRLQKDLSLNTMKMQHIGKQFNTVKNYFDTQKQINDDLIAQGIKLRQQNRQFEVKIVEINKKLKQLNKIKPYLQDIQTDYRKFLFKVDNIVPLVNEAQINESLYKILPSKFHPRIAVYQFERYLQLNEKVLSRHFQENAIGIQFNGQQLIRQSQQRNTKLLTKLKRQYYKNNGVDLDFISFEQRQRLLNDFDYPKLCQIVDQLEELQNEKNDKKKNHKLTQNDIITIVNKQMQSQKNLLIQKIHNQINDSKTYLQCSSQEIFKLIEKIQLKITKLDQNLTNSKNLNQLTIKHFNNWEKQISINLSTNQDKINSLHNVNQQVSNYLQKNFQVIKKINNLEKKFEIYDKLHSVSVHNKSIQKHALYKEENIKSKLGVMMMMSDSDENHDSQRIIHQKQNYAQQVHQYTQEEGQKMIENIKKSLEKFSAFNNSQIKLNNIKFQSSYSKITKPSDSESKFRSQSSFTPLRKQLGSYQLNKSSQIHKSPEKRDEKGFLNIPSFQHLSGTKYCREAYTSRLSMRKKVSLTPSRAKYSQSKDLGLNIKNEQVKNSMSYFSQLKKQNSRYLH